MSMIDALTPAQRKVLDAVSGGNAYPEATKPTIKVLFDGGLVDAAVAPFTLTATAKTLYEESDVMRHNKTADFVTGQAVQYLKWGGLLNRFAYDWVDAEVVGAGATMLTLKYAENGLTGHRRAISVRSKPALPLIALMTELATTPMVNPVEPDLPAYAPRVWATPERRAEVSALLDSKKVYPQTLEPANEQGVWLIEDEWTVKTMQRTLNQLGVIIVGKLSQDWLGDVPYTTALFKLPAPDTKPYPSERQTKPLLDTDVSSIQHQYEEAGGTLPITPQFLIQRNGEEWDAYGIDAVLFRRFAPTCTFDSVVINNKGEQWDRLIVPASLLEEAIQNANTEGGVTVALVGIVGDEPMKLPERAVIEIHAPGMPVQYVGTEAAPEAPVVISPETLAAYPAITDKSPVLVVTPVPPPVPTLPAVPAPVANNAGAISPLGRGAKLMTYIEEPEVRVELAEVVTNLMARLEEIAVEMLGEWVAVDEVSTPTHLVDWHEVRETAHKTLEEIRTVQSGKVPTVLAPVANSAGAIRLHLGGVLRVGTVYAIANAADGYFEVLFLNPVPKSCIETMEQHYDIQQTPNKSFLRVRPKGIGADVFAQTEAVLAAEIEPTADLLDEAAERKLIESLMVAYPDLSDACFGVTQFLANVIARLQREAAGVLVQPY